LFTFELLCVAVALELMLSLSLISSIPSMIDTYCNCHHLIGDFGWINITSNVLQLAAAALLLTQIGLFSNNFKVNSGFT